MPALLQGRTLNAIRWGALGAFLGIPVLGLVAPAWAGRAVWTVVVAALPLLIVVAGYHHWRRICPLAWISRLAATLGSPGQRRASPWLQANYYYLTFGLLFVSLWLRLIATNGNGTALALFFVLVSLAALAFGSAYTGKTWCNYVCPVSLVEKIYTEPRGLRPTANSECAKCTACKPACPDINEENGYWKDALSPPKRFAYFAFPGLVASFYLYYWLQAGSWDYYFTGRWTNEPALPTTAFLPGVDASTSGLFFFPSLPRAAAASFTLALGAHLSYWLFRAAESRLARLTARLEGWDATHVRHVMFTAAAFAAFVTFYTFAGAPTTRLIPGAPHLVQVATVATATLFLARRFARRQASYVEETLARQIIRRWAWVDMEPPKDLHEALLIHRIRSQTHSSGYARLLDVYKDAVREVVESGFISRAQVQHLESLRSQLQINQADHEKIMADLDEEKRARIKNPVLDVSAEKRLQLEAYSRALQRHLESAGASAEVSDDPFCRGLVQAYGVSREEHAAVLDELLGTGDGVAAYVTRAFETIETALGTIRFLGGEHWPAGDFLADTLRRRTAHSAAALMRWVGWSQDDERADDLHRKLLSDDGAVRAGAVEELGAPLASAIATCLVSGQREAARRAAERSTLTDHVRPHLASADPYVRVSALYVLGERGQADAETLDHLSLDEHDIVRETAEALRRRAGRPARNGLVTVERLLALRSVPLLVSLAPEDLASLARTSYERRVAAGQTLCVEGEAGDEVFVVLSGDATVLRRHGGEQTAVGTERTGAFFGELAVLDPGPRAATVVAGEGGVHVLCLGGSAFREVLRSSPSMVSGVMRALVGRIRSAGTESGQTGGAPSPAGVGVPPGPSAD